MIMLDEPTNGMDPQSRKNLLTYLKAISKYKCVIIISQRIDDLETICDKIGIIINGQLKAIGSPCQLKKEYGEGGYILKVELQHEDKRDLVHSRITNAMPFCSLVSTDALFMSTLGQDLFK